MQKDVGGYVTFESSGLRCIDQLALKGTDLKLFALGRHCLEAVCKAFKPRVLLVPTFTCSSVKKTAARQGLTIRYYSINEDFVPQLDAVQKDELLVLNNYFGLSAYSPEFDDFLQKVPEDKVLIDNTHSIGLRNQFPGRLSFMSPRKFLPVTDGGILFDPYNLIADEYMPQELDVSWHRMEWLFRAIDEHGRQQSYSEYIHFRNDLQDLKYLRLSEVTRHLLSIFNIDSVIRQRNSNFMQLREELPMHPYFAWTMHTLSEFAAIGYPIFVRSAREAQLIMSKFRVYAIRYWPDLEAESRMNQFERKLLQHLLFLSTDTLPNRQQLFAIRMLLESDE